MSDYSLTSEIERIVQRSVRFLMTYWGEVLSTADPKGKGRVLVAVPMLGWDTRDKAAWAQPRDKHGMDVPEAGEYVMVGFLEGNRDRPYYTGQAHEFAGQKPDGYSGPKSVVVYQSPDGSQSISVDRTTGKVTVDTTGDVEVRAGGAASVEAGTTATIKGKNANVEGSLFVTLKSGDATIWQPNVLPVDPITGLPHGGATAGIVKLKGG